MKKLAKFLQADKTNLTITLKCKNISELLSLLNNYNYEEIEMEHGEESSADSDDDCSDDEEININTQQLLKTESNDFHYQISFSFFNSINTAKSYTSAIRQIELHFQKSILELTSDDFHEFFKNFSQLHKRESTLFYIYNDRRFITALNFLSKNVLKLDTQFSIDIDYYFSIYGKDYPPFNQY